MNKAITFGGAEFLADPSGALYWPAEKTLLVADLHFEKASHFAARGYHLPPYDSMETLSRLHSAMHAYDVETVITLGDSWHDVYGPGRMAQEDCDMLKSLASQARFIWISGNHDPQPTQFGAHIAHYERAGFHFVHEATRKSRGPVFCGHYHPKVRVKVRKVSRALPCFAVYDTVCVLPSFGAFTGGLDLQHPALAEPLGMPHTAYACGKTRVYKLALSRPSLIGASDAPSLQNHRHS